MYSVYRSIADRARNLRGGLRSLSPLPQTAAAAALAYGYGTTRQNDRAAGGEDPAPLRTRKFPEGFPLMKPEPETGPLMSMMDDGPNFSGPSWDTPILDGGGDFTQYTPNFGGNDLTSQVSDKVRAQRRSDLTSRFYEEARRNPGRDPRINNPGLGDRAMNIVPRTDGEARDFISNAARGLEPGADLSELFPAPIVNMQLRHQLGRGDVSRFTGNAPRLNEDHFRDNYWRNRMRLAPFESSRTAISNLNYAYPRDEADFSFRWDD